MDFSIPGELVLLQESVREFVRRELMPLEAQVELDDDIEPEVMRRLRGRAVDQGFYAFNIPGELGGGGLGPLGQALVGLEMGRTTMALGEAIGRLPQSIVHSTGSQLEWLLKPALVAEVTACNALTEPDAGSDLSRVQTRAVRDGDHWRLTGNKQFISNAETSDYIFVLAVTDPDASLKRRFTMFAVDRTNPGLHFTHRFRKMGWRGYHISSFALDACKVRADQALGEVGSGFDSIMGAVNTTRLYLAAKCVGTAQELMRLTTEYARNRSTFGQALANHQAIQFQVADMDVELEAARWLVLRAAWQGEMCQPDFRIAAARAKLYATEMLCRTADRAVQIFGGAGYMSDLPIERMYRDARAFRIGEGTSEMQRIQIARHALAAS